MLKKLSDTVTFGVVGLVIASLCFYYFWQEFRWEVYEAWLVAWTISAFIMCWIATRTKKFPMRVIYGQSILGGFLGAWFGMFGFWYQVSNWRFWGILITSAILQGGLIRVLL